MRSGSARSPPATPRLGNCAPLKAAFFCSLLERLEQGVTVIYQTRHRRRDGSELDVEISARVVIADGRRFTQEMVRDVSDRVAAERALAERERTLSTLLGNLPGMAYRCRNVPGWTMEFVSDGCRDLTGYGADELVGPGAVAFEDLIHPHDRAIVRAEVARALESDGRFTVTYRIRRRDGEERWVWDRGRPFAGPQSGGAVHEGFMTDVTDRVLAERALADSEQRFRSLFERLEQGVYYADAEGRIIAGNPAAERILGVGLDDLVARALGDPRWRVVRPDGGVMPASDFPSVVALSSGRPVTGELLGVVRESDGDIRWVTVDAVPEFSAGPGAPSGVFCALVDVTERVVAERGLRELSEGLERRVEERTGELRAANRELEAFSYSVSHDLRAPLRAIDGFSLALVEDYGETLPAEGREYLRRVRAASQRMGDLIDDLLSLSRVTRAEMTRAPVDLSALAQEVVDELRSLRGEDGVTYIVAPDATAAVDPHLVHVLLMNLIDNARKFSSPVEHPTVEFGFSGGGSGTQTTYFVRDNGVGFDLSFAERLFGPFQRFHAPGDFEGTGVGLATASRVVRRHGGWIWAESAPGQGATFYFTFGDESDSVTEAGGGPADADGAGREGEEDTLE